MSNEIYKVGVHDVIKAVHRLKHGKSEGLKLLIKLSMDLIY